MAFVIIEPQAGDQITDSFEYSSLNQENKNLFHFVYAQLGFYSFPKGRTMDSIFSREENAFECRRATSREG